MGEYREIREIIYSLLIIIGVTIDIILCFKIPLDSDTVMPGIAAISFKDNMFLGGLNTRDMNPNTLEILYHLPFQIISGYNPVTLRIISFIIFLLIILVYSLIVYKATKDIDLALLFAAILSNAGILLISLMVLPMYHNSTILVAGLCTLLYDYINNRTKILFLLLFVLMIYTDALFFVIFVIPYIVINFYESAEIDIPILITSLSVVFFKSVLSRFTLYAGVYGGVRTNTLDNINNFLNTIMVFTNSNIEKIKSIEFIDTSIIYLIFFSAIIIFLIYNIKNIKREIVIPLIGSIGLCVGYLTGLYAMDRYLVFVVIVLFLLIITLSKNKDKLQFLLLLFAISGMLANAIIVPNMINDEIKYENLAKFLVENGYVYGYSDYNIANVVTYFSKGLIHVMPMYPNNNGFEYGYSNMRVDWLHDANNTFILIGPQNEMSKGFYNATMMYVERHKPSGMLVYGNYTIFKYDHLNINGSIM